MYAALKHCFATNAIAGGGAESDLTSYLGHKDEKSTRQYVLTAQQRYGSIQARGIEGREKGSDPTQTGNSGRGSPKRKRRS
jgi:integrase